MTTSETIEQNRVQEARAVCVAEVTLMNMRGDLLDGSRVASLINDFCIEVRCRRDQMPVSLKSLYDTATRLPTKLYDKTEFIRLIEQSV